MQIAMIPLLSELEDLPFEERPVLYACENCLRVWTCWMSRGSSCVFFLDVARMFCVLAVGFAWMCSNVSAVLGIGGLWFGIFLHKSPTDHDLDHLHHVDRTGPSIHIDHTDHVDHVDHTDHKNQTNHVDHTNHIDHIDNIDHIDHVQYILYLPL